MWGQLLLVVSFCISKGGINLEYKPKQFKLEDFYIMNIFIETGFILKEIIIKEQHNCKRTGYWSKNQKRDFYLLAYEYVFVLKK